MLRITWSRGVAAIVVVAVMIAVVVLNDDNEPAAMSDRSATPRAVDEIVDAPGCGINTRGASTGVPTRRDVQVGPLILMGANQWGETGPNAFEGHGYKVPALLPNGAAITLSVHESMRGHAGLVYSAVAQDLQRVGTTGVGGAEASVRFTACPAEQAGRTGWVGGIVVDRPRCVTLVVEVAGRPPIYGRVPLGRPCHGPAPVR